MDKNDAKKRIEKLKGLINKHRYSYHVLDRQSISDEAFDSLKHELFLLEQEHPSLIAPDSPTQRVGGEALKKFKKVEHSVPMLSIEDVFSEEELEDWQKYIKRISGESEIEYYSELKIDGFAISLVYRDGVFFLGATRGNGKVGEDVTQNLKTIESIPLKLELQGDFYNKRMQDKVLSLMHKGEVNIRGEVFMERKDFEKLNRLLEKKNQKAYSNPRNLAAGSIRQLDPKLAASRPLKFLAYDIVTDLGQEKHSEEHELLPLLGFKTNPGKVCGNLKEVIGFWKEIDKKRKKLSYEIDGIVVNINSNRLVSRLGRAGKGMRGMRAFKFSASQAATKIEDIKLQVGRTGAVTPIAVLKPVSIGGVTITRATLHNEDEIKRLGAKIGDTVIVERAGDVIPAVSGVIKELRDGKEKEFNFPKVCPVCDAKLVKPEGEAVWRCPSKGCAAIKARSLHHFVSKKAFDIEGFGPKIIDQLLEEKLISSASDIFGLKEGDLVPLERFAERKAKNLMQAAERSKEIPLSRFVYSLGIRHVGEETAIDLADHFGSLDRIKKASQEELESVLDIGRKVSESIYQWFRSEKNIGFVDSLLKAGVRIIEPKGRSSKLKGKIFVLTGSLDSMSREEAIDKVRSLGGKVSGSVSSNTDYVVAGSEPGSKYNKAEKLGVKIIGEREFLDLIK